MSADKRTPHTDALETLGKIHEFDEKRDAIHLAVYPVEAGEFLIPGENIRVDNGKAYTCTRAEGLGIADPFIESGQIQKGQRFWLVIYPREIRSLRHVWEHPAFPSSVEEELTITGTSVEPEVQVSEEQIAEALAMMGHPVELAKITIREVAEQFDVTYDWLMDEADQAQTDKWHLARHPEDSGRFEGQSLPQRFWDAYATVKGVPREKVKDDNFFSCSC